MAWTYTSGQVNPDSDKIFNFSTKISDQKFGVHPDSAPHFRFGAPIYQVVLPMTGPHARSQLPPGRDKIFGFSGYTNLQGASEATTSAANEFQFGALANLQAPTASFTAP